MNNGDGKIGDKSNSKGLPNMKSLNLQKVEQMKQIDFMKANGSSN